MSKISSGEPYSIAEVWEYISVYVSVCLHTHTHTHTHTHIYVLHWVQMKQNDFDWKKYLSLVRLLEMIQMLI